MLALVQVTDSDYEHVTIVDLAREDLNHDQVFSVELLPLAKLLDAKYFQQ